jgi:hypothetical protein
MPSPKHVCWLLLLVLLWLLLSDSSLHSLGRWPSRFLLQLLLLLLLYIKTAPGSATLLLLLSCCCF